jgi:hypothetical protein
VSTERKADGVGEITAAKASVVGQEATPKPDGTLEIELPQSDVTLKVTHEPEGEEIEKWQWKKGEPGDPVGSSKDTYPVEFSGEGSETYFVEVTPKSGQMKASNKVVLKAKEKGAPDKGVSEIEIGEYDKAFARASGIVFAVLAIAGLFLLIRDVSLELPGLTGDAPTSGTYSERLRAFAVIGSLGMGIPLLAAGAWLASLEVRGRLRRPVTVTLASDTEAKRGAIDEVSKVLDSATKLRGTVAVLVAGTALILGTLWATREATPEQGSSSSSSTDTGTSDPTPNESGD